jgi:HEAT repeat protein
MIRKVSKMICGLYHLIFRKLLILAWQIRPQFQRVAFALLVSLAIILTAGRTYGNGWEHGAIPFEALIKALEFESPDMRKQAAHSLGFRGQPEAVDPILKRLAKPEENSQVRSAFYLALGRLDDRRAVPALKICLDKEARDDLRSDCVIALGMLGENSTLPRLLKAFYEDSSFLVRSSVVDALGSFSEEAAVEILATLVNNESNHSLRQRAIRALGRTGSQEAVKPLLKALAVFRSDNERLLIVNSLTLLRPSEATVPLTELLQKTEDPQLRTQIVIALGAIHEGDTYPTLIDMLTDKVPAVRYFAVKSLHELGRREAAIPISKLSLEITRRFEQRTTRELLADPLPVIADLSFQLMALQALTDLDATKGMEALLRAARPREFPRDSAVALKIAEGVYRQRRTALNGLGYIGSQEAAAFLAGPGGLRDPDFRLRAVAARSLGILGFSEMAEKLLDLLDDPVAEVRWTAALVLGRLGDRKAVGPLMERLSDINAEVRRQAALSLGYLGDRRAYEALTRLARDEESETVQAAAAYGARLLEK